MKRRFFHRFFGLLVCAGAALGAVFTFAGHPWRVFVPLFFVVVIAVVGMCCGMLVALLGSITAAILFAYFLFPPLASVQVADATARGNLGWMVLGGVVLSFLLFKPPHGGSKTPHRK